MQTKNILPKVSLDNKNEKMLTILVLEDDVSLSRIIVHKLKARGHNPLLALSVDEAMSIIKSGESVDILWLDILLPGGSGLDFLEYVRGNEETKDMKAFIVSASGGADQQEEARRLGAIEYVVKGDYSLDEIIERIVAE